MNKNKLFSELYEIDDANVLRHLHEYNMGKYVDTEELLLAIIKSLKRMERLYHDCYVKAILNPKHPESQER